MQRHAGSAAATPAWSAWPASGAAIGSRAAVLIAAAALAPGEACERVDGGAGIGMRIQPAPSLGADAAPLAEQECAAEQVWPDLHAIEAPFIAFGADAAQRGSVGEQRQLDRRRTGGGRFVCVWA